MAEQKKSRATLANEEEIALLKDAFADNEYLLQAIRKVFFGFDITKTDADLISSVFKNVKLKDAFRKKLYPTFSEDVAIGEATDFWFGTETEILGKDPETIKQVVQSKKEVERLLFKGIELLSDPLSGKIEIPFLSLEEDPFQVSLLARQKYIRTVETALVIIKTIAGTKNETVEQTKKRLEADSAK